MYYQTDPKTILIKAISYKLKIMISQLYCIINDLDWLIFITRSLVYYSKTQHTSCILVQNGSTLSFADFQTQNVHCF